MKKMITDCLISQLQINFQKAKLVDERNNKISVTETPQNWPITGIWKFRQDGKKCRIDDTEGMANMTWNC